MLKADIFLEDQVINYPENFIENPLVSVIMPTYCRGDNGMLARAIESVLNQTYENFELIIVDDGSIDSTSGVIKKFQESDDRIIHIRHDLNCGLPALRVNEGLMLARGKYVAYQFDDDQWVKETLDILLQESESCTTPTLVYGNCIYRQDGNEYIFGGTFSYSTLIEQNIIANNTVMHPITLFKHFGGYDCHVLMRRLCDWDLWIRWAKKVPFKHINKTVSIVEAGEEFSLGQTVPYDLTTFRVVNNLNRDYKLTPETLRSYECFSVEHLKDYVGRTELNKIYTQQILPWALRHRAILKENGIEVSYSLDELKTMLVTKFQYDTNIDITINNFNDFWSNLLFTTFVPESQLTSKLHDKN
ncbi:glycosyltransferase family 2 protein [Paenibacillus sp. DMB20]|uniref:glycosyltransferase family 2 protein n=1 Tax=Paenibacillus sp. DMB20 TaxID=1642570 RepID=UPI0006277F5B|nr:glycosyltransferase [Paenibacillus sp. DMB20]KKO54764.1 hypothetical protein XI25_04550 [Paenibacillus sp. DMB20]